MMDRKWLAVIAAAALPAVALVVLPGMAAAQGYDTQLDKGGTDTGLDKGGLQPPNDTSGIDKSVDANGNDTSLDKSEIDKDANNIGVDNPAKTLDTPASSGPKIIHAPNGSSN